MSHELFSLVHLAQAAPKDHTEQLVCVTVSRALWLYIEHIVLMDLLLHVMQGLRLGSLYVYVYTMNYADGQTL